MDFGILLNLAFQTFKTGLQASLNESGFSDMGSSFGYVFRLLSDKPLMLKDVSDRLEITPQGASKIIQEMVQKGYVSRELDPTDGRITRLTLTPRAREAMVCAARYHKRFEAALARELGPSQTSAARAVLESIASRMPAGAAAIARPS